MMTKNDRTRRLPFPSILTLAALVALGLATGCGRRDQRSEGAGGDHAEHEGHDGHGHGEAPHGGHLIVLGEEDAHLEVLHDEDAGVLVVHVLDAEMKPLPIEQAPVLNLTFASGPKQLEGKAARAGASSEWRFEDAVLREEPESGRFRLVIGETVYTPALEHEHEHEE